MLQNYKLFQYSKKKAKSLLLAKIVKMWFTINKISFDLTILLKCKLSINKESGGGEVKERKVTNFGSKKDKTVISEINSATII